MQSKPSKSNQYVTGLVQLETDRCCLELCLWCHDRGISAVDRELGGSDRAFEATAWLAEYCV